jgi:DNA-binding NarL/FixJ family response regulator
MQDAAWFSAQVMERLAQLRVDGTERADFTELTRREQQILGMMAKGHSNEQIGAELSLAKQTVRNYVASIYSKLGVHSRAAAVVWARERGLGSF